MYRILAYHRIGDEDVSPLSVSPDDFARQLRRLRRWGFSIVTLKRLETERARRTPGRWVALTFDDGYRDNYGTAAPMMREEEASGTFFVPTALLDTDGRMTWDQVGSLAEIGHEIGSHSRTHRDLPGVDAAALEDEVAGSREDIRSKLGIDAESFAYPRGLYDAAAEAAVRSAGYQRAVVTPRGAGHRPGQFSIERIGIYRHTGATEFSVKMLGIYSQLKRYRMGARISAMRHRSHGRDEADRGRKSGRPRRR